MSREYVHVGAHAEILSSGRSIGPGDRVPEAELTEHDQHLLDEEHLVDVASFGGADNGQPIEDVKKQAAELEIEGRSKMGADKLRAAVAEREMATAPKAQNEVI